MDKQKCPKCNSTANVVKLIRGYRCIYCGIEFGKDELSGQTKLKEFVRI